MTKPTHVSQAGGEILPGVDDGGCATTRCTQCMKDVPLSATLSEEGADYMHHFCGLDCLDAWRRRARQEFPPSSSA